jgi:competence protein ComEA
VGAAVVLVVVALGCAVLFSALTDRGTSAVVAPAASVGPTASGSSIYVHVLGAVERAGLYELRDGDRVVDAIAAAGGFEKDADQGAVNLARFVDDGEQIVVPEVGTVPPSAPGTDASGLVNINTADESTLETLPRVGPAMAQRIIAYREQNGRFASVDDLRNVTGIGDKTFAQLEPLVTI